MSNATDLIIFGSGQLAEVAKTYFDAHGSLRVIGFTVDAAYQQANTFCGLPVAAWEDLEKHFPPDRVQVIGPISYRRLNQFRRDRHQEGKRRGYRFASFVHPAAHVYADSIGENSFILEANIIQPRVRIGEGAIIWSNNHIGHHASIGDYCFIASTITIGSNARIGSGSFISGCSAIDPGAEVGENNIVMPLAYVKGQTPPGSVVEGDKASAISRVPSARIMHLF